jgi:hypothetical protein
MVNGIAVAVAGAIALQMLFAAHVGIVRPEVPAGNGSSGVAVRHPPCILIRVDPAPAPDAGLCCPP